MHCSRRLDFSKLHHQIDLICKRIPIKRSPVSIYLIYVKFSQQYVSQSLHHPVNPLWYAAEEFLHATEVSACPIEPEFKPSEFTERMSEDTEPDTVTRISGKEIILQRLRRNKCRKLPL